MADLHFLFPCFLSVKQDIHHDNGEDLEDKTCIRVTLDEKPRSDARQDDDDSTSNGLIAIPKITSDVDENCVNHDGATQKVIEGHSGLKEVENGADYTELRKIKARLNRLPLRVIATSAINNSQAPCSAMRLARRFASLWAILRQLPGDEPGFKSG